MDDFEVQEKRIAEIFGVDDLPGVAEDSLETYFDYLETKLEPGTKVSIEEGYMSGTLCQFLFIDDLLDDHHGLLAHVRILKNNDTPVIPLCDLEAVDKSSPAYQLIDDYATWFVNWR